MDELRLPTPPPIVHAPKYRLDPPGNRLHLATVEYPGPVNSVQNALDSLGGLASVAHAFTAAQPRPSDRDEPDAVANEAATAHRVPLEFNLDPGNRFSHPVQAHIQPTSNIVCRIVKRRRKKPVRNAVGDIVDAGMYQIQPVAVEHRLARFRAMADYQYTPPRHAGGDPSLDMAQAIENLDINGIRNFDFPPPSEDFPEAAFLPPPTFSRHPLPAIFDMQPAPGTIRVTTDAGVTRLINAGRYKVRTVQSILHVQPDVPTGPEPVLLAELGRDELSPIEEKMDRLLEERPCWTRTALLNQLSPEEHKAINANKSCWPMISYTFADGPFRDLVIRYGYDPRTDPEARFYQHIALRNLANVRTRAQPGTRAQAQAGAASSRRTDKAPTTSNLSHEFDGEHVYGKIGHFQLCDISDPLVKSLIDSPDGVLPACSSDPSEGWYAFDYLEQIRQVLRRKWQGLLNGVHVTSADCQDLLAWDLSNQSRAGQPKRPRTSTATAPAASGRGGSKRRGGRRRRSGTRNAADTGSDDDDDDDEAEDSSNNGSAGSGGSSGSGRGPGRSQGRNSDVWRSDQTSDDDDSLDSADEAARAAARVARGNGVGSLSARPRRSITTRATAAASGAPVTTTPTPTNESSSPAPGPSSPSATGPGPSGSGGGTTKSSGASKHANKTATAAQLAPWERPKKKRARAKLPETEAELFARVSRAARRTSTAATQRPPSTSESRLPRIDPETGEEEEGIDEADSSS